MSLNHNRRVSETVREVRVRQKVLVLVGESGLMPVLQPTLEAYFLVVFHPHDEL